MQRLPEDVVLTVCCHLALPDVVRLLGCCKAWAGLRAAEDFFRQLAHAWHGRDFWGRALTRRTRRAYAGMRGELVTMHRFEAVLRACGFPPWTRAEYEAFWQWEAEAASRQRDAARSMGAVP